MLYIYKISILNEQMNTVFIKNIVNTSAHRKSRDAVLNLAQKTISYTY
jgi:hypothetical protein